VAKRLIGSGYRLVGELAWSSGGCIRRGGDRRREGAVLGVNLGRTIVTNGDLLHSCARATPSSQMTLGGLVIIIIYLQTRLTEYGIVSAFMI